MAPRNLDFDFFTLNCVSLVSCVRIQTIASLDVLWWDHSTDQQTCRIVVIKTSSLDAVFHASLKSVTGECFVIAYTNKYAGVQVYDHAGVIFYRVWERQDSRGFPILSCYHADINVFACSRLILSGKCQYSNILHLVNYKLCDSVAFKQSKRRCRFWRVVNKRTKGDPDPDTE